MLQLTTKYVLGVVVLAATFLLLARSEKVDAIAGSALALLGLAAAILLLPWHRMTSFKAGGLELAVTPGVESAVRGHGQADADSLMRMLRVHEQSLPFLLGARILWIEDRPRNVLAERRILRALRTEIVMGVPDVLDPKPIEDLVRRDNDFDLVISDIQWRDAENRPTYGGLHCVCRLRSADGDRNLRSLPVVFYTAYSKEQVERILRDEKVPYQADMYFSHDVEDLVRRAVLCLAATREKPIKLDRKTAT